MKSNCSLNLWGCNSKPVPSEIHLAERKHIQFYHCPICFGISENHSVIQLPKFARLYIRNGAGRSNPEQDNSQCSPRPRAILLSSYLWDHTKDSWIIMKVQEDRNTQKVDQYGTSFTIWLMGQGLFALDGEASSSRTSPCPVLWYIVRNSSHPQTSALEDKSGKQNHLRAQDVLPVHPVPTIWSRSSSTCKTAMVETCKPYFAKVLQSNSYTIITTLRFDDVWLTQGSFICPWRELTPW